MTAHFRLGGAISLDAQNADHQFASCSSPGDRLPEAVLHGEQSRLQIATPKRCLSIAMPRMLARPEGRPGHIRELTFRRLSTSNNAEGGAVALQDDVDRAMDAVFQKQFRCLEAIFVSQMVGDDRLAGVQRKPPDDSRSRR